MEVHDETTMFNISENNEMNPQNSSNNPSFCSDRTADGGSSSFGQSKADRRPFSIPPIESIPILVDNVPYFLSQAEDGSPIYIRQQPPTIEEMFVTSSSEGNPSFDGFSDASGSTFEGFSENSRNSSVTFEGFIENQASLLNADKLKLLETFSVKEEPQMLLDDSSHSSLEAQYCLTSTPSVRPGKSAMKQKKKNRDKSLKTKKIKRLQPFRQSRLSSNEGNTELLEQEPLRITRQAVQKVNQNVSKIVSPRLMNRSQRLSFEEKQQPAVEVIVSPRLMKRSQRLSFEEKKQPAVEVMVSPRLTKRSQRLSFEEKKQPAVEVIVSPRLTKKSQWLSFEEKKQPAVDVIVSPRLTKRTQRLSSEEKKQPVVEAIVSPRLTKRSQRLSSEEKKQPVVEAIVSPRVTKRSQRLSSEEKRQSAVDVTPVLSEAEDYIGPYCKAVGCTISFLESMRVKYLSVNNGIVYELDEFAKRISWDRIYVAKWIQRLTGVRNKTIEPTADDMLKINLVLKRRKALKVTLAGQKVGGSKMKEFDQTKFILPSSIKEEEESEPDEVTLEREKQRKRKKREAPVMSSTGDTSVQDVIDVIKEESQPDEEIVTRSNDERSKYKRQKSELINQSLNSVAALPGLNEIKSENEADDLEVKDELTETYEFHHSESVGEVKEEDVMESPKEIDLTKTQAETNSSVGTFGVSKSGRLRKPSVKGKQSVEIKSLFMSPEKATTNMSESLEDDDFEEPKSSTKQPSNIGKGSVSKSGTRDTPDKPGNSISKLKCSNKYKKLIDLDNAVISFTFTDGHFVPRFKELDYNIGPYCQKAGVTVKDINAETEMDVQLTKGLVKELHDFYVSRGGPKTALAIRLLKMKGLPFSDYNDVLAIVARVGKIAYVGMDTKKLEQPFVLGPEKKRQQNIVKTNICPPVQRSFPTARGTGEGSRRETTGRHLSRPVYPSDEGTLGTWTRNRTHLTRPVSPSDEWTPRTRKRKRRDVTSSSVTPDKSTLAHTSKRPVRSTCSVSTRTRGRSADEVTFTEMARKGPVTELVTRASSQNSRLKQYQAEEELNRADTTPSKKADINRNKDCVDLAGKGRADNTLKTDDSLRKKTPTSSQTDTDAFNREVLVTRGKEGSVTRGDIVYLYTQWLKNKMAPGSNVFVTDLLKDVETLMVERKVRPIRIPAGTLMSSSVRLYDEYKQMLSSSREDSRMYLEEDWLEDIQYLVSISTSSRRNTVDGEDRNVIDGEESSVRQANVSASSDSGSDRDLIIDEADSSVEDTPTAKAELDLKIAEKGFKKSSKPLTSRLSVRKSPAATLKSPVTTQNSSETQISPAATQKSSTPIPKPSFSTVYYQHELDSKDSLYKPTVKVPRSAKKLPCMTSVGKRSRKKDTKSLLMNDFDYEYEEDFLQTKSENDSDEEEFTPREIIEGRPPKLKLPVAGVSERRISERLKDVKKPTVDNLGPIVTNTGRKGTGLTEECEVDRIVDYREVHDRNKTKYYKYLIRWLGFGPEEDSWVDEKHLHCPEKVAEYWRVLKREKQLRFVRMKSSNTIQYTPIPRTFLNPKASDVVVQSKSLPAARTPGRRTSSTVDESEEEAFTQTPKFKAAKVKELSTVKSRIAQKKKKQKEKKDSKINKDNLQKIDKNIQPQKISKDILSQKINKDTLPQNVESPSVTEDSKVKNTVYKGSAARKLKGGGQCKNLFLPAKEKTNKENKVNIIEAMIQHSSVGLKLKGTMDTERPVTRRELLDMYDSWRQENKNVLMAGGSNTVNVDVLVTRAKDLMAARHVKKFHPESLLSACFMMTLMRMRLKSERALNRFLDSNCLEVLETSHRLHRSAQHQHNDGDIHKRTFSSDVKASVANLRYDLQNIKHEMSSNLEQRQVNCTSLEVLEGEVECLEKVMNSARAGSSKVTSLLQQEVNALKTDLSTLENITRTGLTSEESSASDQTKKEPNKPVVDLTDSLSGQLREEVLHTGQNLIKHGVPSKMIDSMIELVVNKISDRRIRARPAGTPSISEGVELMHK